MASIGISEPSLPSVQRVVVAVAHERPDAGGVQAAQTVDEGLLGAQAAIGAVVNVAGDQQCFHSLGDAQVDDVSVGIKCGGVKRPGYILGCRCPDAPERTVQMEVCSVDKSEGHS